MTDPSPIRRSARPIGFAGLALAALAFLVACTSASATPSAAPPDTSSPVAVASQSPAGASPSADVASPSVGAPSASPSTAPGRYYTGDATPTPKPTAGATPKPTPKPTPQPASLVVKSRSTSLGKVLVGPNGMTLYTRKSDPTNGSTCTGGCADSWPPFLVKTGTVVSGGSGIAGKFATFSRSGKRQVTYKGRALYYFAGDAYVGDTNGQGLGGVWYVATP